LGGVVLPAFRGRGLYRALVTARLRYAAEREIPFATSHARANTSAPLLERLGFETLCRFPVFSND
ncbi:MAG TPA: GNAT family N-acetyltransferase, partial [Archangium sp.]|nr:GNAT family N-acetyltransferase [Archangium sp.]